MLCIAAAVAAAQGLSDGMVLMLTSRQGAGVASSHGADFDSDTHCPLSS
jgi:hypothetical protein